MFILFSFSWLPPYYLTMFIRIIVLSYVHLMFLLYLVIWLIVSVYLVVFLDCFFSVVTSAVTSFSCAASSARFFLMLHLNSYSSSWLVQSRHTRNEPAQNAGQHTMRTHVFSLINRRRTDRPTKQPNDWWGQNNQPIDWWGLNNRLIEYSTTGHLTRNRLTRIARLRFRGK